MEQSAADSFAADFFFVAHLYFKIILSQIGCFSRCLRFGVVVILHYPFERKIKYTPKSEQHSILNNPRNVEMTFHSMTMSRPFLRAVFFYLGCFHLSHTSKIKLPLYSTCYLYLYMNGNS